jgi:hypothetical protein
MSGVPETAIDENPDRDLPEAQRRMPGCTAAVPRPGGRIEDLAGRLLSLLIVNYVKQTYRAPYSIRGNGWIVPAPSLSQR